MADARLNSQWLNHPRFDDLSDAAWRVFTGALMWSNGRGTDGHVPTRYVRLLHPDGPQADACKEIEEAGLWETAVDGYVLFGWAGDLGQSTAAQVEQTKENNRQRQQRFRDEQAKRASEITPKSRPVGDVTRYGTRDETAYVGQDSDRTGSSSKPVSKHPKPPPVSDEEFDRFWDHYPRKQAKAVARTAFLKARKTTSLEVLLNGSQSYALMSIGTDKSYLKLPAGWLNDRRWEDESLPTVPSRQTPERYTQTFAPSQGAITLDETYCPKHAGYPITPYRPCAACAEVPEGNPF
ncbi:hypothetical protein [Subtercola boreus]|uniref:hypothetical protein n=1 Tax=Subtercola boreus TaxID=120213 RepID=UPI0011502D73|nr:hypothetical protein [Subtercola boreus]